MEVLILHTIIEDQQQKAHRLHCSPEKNQIHKQCNVKNRKFNDVLRTSENDNNTFSLVK